MLNIEKALKDFEDSGGRDFFRKYLIVKSRLLNFEYTQTSAEFPGGNDHGPNHVLRVLKRLDDLLGPTPLVYLNVFELWLSMMAIVYHDLGLLHARKDHPQIGADLMLGEQNAYIFDKRERDIISVAILTHGSTADIDERCQRYPSNYKIADFAVATKCVCALVRFADELDEDFRRGDEELFRRRGIAERYPDSVPFWRFNQCVQSVHVDPPGGVRREVELQMQFDLQDAELVVKNKDGATISFAAFVAHKVLKINQERAYCNRLLPEPLRISGIRLTLLPGQLSSLKVPKPILIDDRTAVEDVLSHFPDEMQRSPKRPEINSSTNATKPIALLAAIAHGEVVCEDDFQKMYDMIARLEDELNIEHSILSQLRNGQFVTVEDMNAIVDCISRIRNALGLSTEWRNWPARPRQLVTSDAFNELLASLNQAAKTKQGTTGNVRPQASKLGAAHTSANGPKHASPAMASSQSSSGASNNKSSPLGFLDYRETYDLHVDRMIEVGNRMALTIAAFNSETRELKNTLRAISPDDAVKMGASAAKRLINEYANAMKHMTSALTREYPTFAASINEGIGAMRHMTYFLREMGTSPATLAENKAVVANFHDVLAETHQGISSFKDGFSALPRMTQELNIAREEATLILGRIIQKVHDGRQLTDEALKQIDALLIDTK